MRNPNHSVLPEADSDEIDLPEAMLEEELLVKGTRSVKKRDEYSARKAIEEHLERKRMQALLDDDLFLEIDE